ncbi:UNKNOWN [Stylonychia lemnae]|uniref:Uncharacterized protein n=1 Tax=Stylonychia lemnae TaxID=5949 RepID=A0A078AW39_STYLE|nr:UNKNOWN [Stylonychia lemnae]|eukprot:CDW86685.1 UNKNOWN [Stylonychia lemnae]
MSMNPLLKLLPRSCYKSLSKPDIDNSQNLNSKRLFVQHQNEAKHILNLPKDKRINLERQIIQDLKIMLHQNHQQQIAISQGKQTTLSYKTKKEILQSQSQRGSQVQQKLNFKSGTSNPVSPVKTTKQLNFENLNNFSNKKRKYEQISSNEEIKINNLLHGEPKRFKTGHEFRKPLSTASLHTHQTQNQLLKPVNKLESIKRNLMKIESQSNMLYDSLRSQSSLQTNNQRTTIRPVVQAHSFK